MKATTLAVAVTFALATSSCSARGDDAVDAGAPGPVPSADAASAGIPTSSAPEPDLPDIGGSSTQARSSTGASQAAIRFGQWFSYGNGLWVKVEDAKPFTPSAWVQPSPGHAMRFGVTVRNRTGKEWNPSQLHVRLTSGLAPAVPIFDYEKRVVARPEDRVPNKTSVRFDVGFWVTDRDQLSIEFAPGFGYESVAVAHP